jgi:hypothetical protein
MYISDCSFLAEHTTRDAGFVVDFCASRFSLTLQRETLELLWTFVLLYQNSNWMPQKTKKKNNTCLSVYTSISLLYCSGVNMCLLKYMNTVNIVVQSK